jgi:hypothetical protein
LLSKAGPGKTCKTLSAKNLKQKRAGGIVQVQSHEFKPKYYKKSTVGWAPMAHACNPSYSGRREQEDHSSKPAWANSLQNPISKIPNTKRAGGVAQGVGSELKPWYHKKKKK